jgi:membrane protein DedA with SNARE-associated domain
MIAAALLASTAIILLSFVSEDAATISSALSIFGGPLSWPLGFLSCFAGIWLGDLGLYSLARCAGKNVLRSRWLARLADPATITRCEKTLAQNSALTLIASRFIPGTRLPTYLAAGLFAMPARRFALITAIGALLWISVFFALTKLLGSHAVVWFTFTQTKIAAFVFTALFLVGVLLIFRKVCRFECGDMSPLSTARTCPHTPKSLLPVFIRRWMQWEFWPAWLFYIPVGVYYAWLAIRHRSLTVPTSANPGIATGGFVGESKLEILDQLRRRSPQFTAEAFLIDGRTTTDRLLCLHRICCQQKIALPFILKPDVGQRGNGVRLIRSMRAVLEYLQEVDAPVILQRYVAAPHEAGVFYYRFPSESRGHIFAITEKIFPVITGDGTRTVKELIRADSRAALMARIYLQRFVFRHNQVLAPSEILQLVETGNHAQGCIFRDGMHLHTNALERVIDEISRKVPGFFIGRYDVRYENEEDFKEGRDFQIVELNGASSEATSIYDARNSLISAYRTLFRQWRLVFAIGTANRANGHAPSSLTALWRNWRQYSAAALSYPLAD